MVDDNKQQQEITGKEKELIDKLQERVKNELPDSVLSLSERDQDLYFVRWLRARDLNLDNAENMLRNSLQWRKDKNADEGVNIVPHSFFSENFQYSFAGADKQGHPVVLLPLSNWDFGKLNASMRNCNELGEGDFENFMIKYFEDICHHIREQHLKRTATHPPVTQVLTLADAESFSYSQLLSVRAMKKVLQFASTFEGHYPEILFRVVVVNTPSYFGLLLSIVKTALAPKTFGKIMCYSQMEAWQKDMEELLDPTTIPARYGGTRNTETN